jgi:3-oxoacyl-[acyl-carrier protein] reductase
MDLGLKGRKVIINGGARGLGLAALKIFVAEGCDVAFFGRDQDKVAAAKAELASGGTTVIGEAFDMAADHQRYRDWLSKASAVATFSSTTLRPRAQAKPVTGK